MEHPASRSALRRYRLATALIVAIAGSGTALTACGRQMEPPMTQSAELERELAALPRGTAADAIGAWLKARGFEHSGLIDNAALAHMGGDPATYEIKSIVRSADGGIVRTDTQLTFTFDRDRRLVGTRVAAIHTGP